MSSEADSTVNLNPGPVPLADRTRRAMAGPMVSHRSAEFEAIWRDCRDRLRSIFRTDNDLIVVNGNGNVGLETAIATCIRPADRVLCLTNGKFGENLADMLARYTGRLDLVETDWGAPFDLDEVDTALTGDTAAVVMAHCETSTGMLNPVRQIAELAAETGALSIVDGVSSIGGEALPVDEWGIDVAVTASQKCLSAPPGLSAMAVSERALTRHRANDRTVPYNLDFDRYRRAAGCDQTPSTAPVHTFRALRCALTDIIETGLDVYLNRQARRANALRQAGEALGLPVFPIASGASRPSNTVTALELPADLPASDLVAQLRARGVLASTGIGPLSDRTIRLATMSNAITDVDVVRAIRALESVVEPTTGGVDPDGVTAAVEGLEIPSSD